MFEIGRFQGAGAENLAQFIEANFFADVELAATWLRRSLTGKLRMISESKAIKSAR
jgi:hypothetical protein